VTITLKARKLTGECKMKRLNEIIMIAILILAACTPVIYANLVKLSDWIYGLTIAWIILAAVYVSFITLKWK